MLECVPNISEGRDADTLAALAAATGRALLDVQADPDHHRSVWTIAHPEPGPTIDAVRRLAAAVADRVDMRDHDGVHPRLGALDVVPFVALAETSEATAVSAARDLARWWADTYAVPTFFYDAANTGDPASRRSLPQVRRDAFTTLAPDLGPAEPHPRLGATAVGVRPPLIAVNVELDSDDLPAAQAVASELRERDGGLPGVRALGFRLASRGHAQVSMNLADLRATGLETACLAARDRLEARGVGVQRVELIGLVPAAELARCQPSFLAWAGISRDQTVERRAALASAADAVPEAAGESAG